MIQQDHLQVFDLCLVVRSPLFIGSGKKYTKKEYLYDSNSGKVSFLNEEKFFDFLVEHELVEQYTQFVLGKNSSLLEFLTKDCGIPNSELRQFSSRWISVGDTLDNIHTLKEIHVFQRDAHGLAYIPGSSVKGALRTAWLMDAVLNDKCPRGNLDSTFPEDRYVNLLHLKDKASDAINSIFRGVQVSDSGSIPDDYMVLAGKTDVFTNGGYNKLNLCRECIRPGTNIRLRLTLDQSILKGCITQETLEKAIRGYDAYYQQTYSRKFTLPPDSAGLPQQPYLILGGGAGFFSKSLVYPYLGERKALLWTAHHLKVKKHNHTQDIQIGISPRTMKYTRFGNALYPYGYCEVNIV